MRPYQAAVLALTALLATTEPARAHDPPADENPLIHYLVEHVLFVIPGWLFLVAAVLIPLGAFVAWRWLRASGAVRFVDRVE